ncbi:hypothetical protein BA6E_125303 [Bacteroidales bacterium 6E]|nr:hypothetical protein BA6E_125303 [Bacteroidales bacterium 6E]
MKNQFQSTLLLMTLLLLIISLAGNYFQHSVRKPVMETVFVTDTLVQVDTIIHTVTQQVTIDRPVPVYVDTTANVRTYRDTIYLPYGTIRGEEVVFGELLKRDLQVDLKIPEVYRTLEVNNAVTRSVRQRMFFATVGIRTDFNHHASPVIGVAYIPNGH